MRPRDLNTPWATLLIDRLAGAGVRHAVISPGSRSTPLVLAAAAEPRIALHTIVDERSAAFFALGQAKVTGRPTLLVCTSGSAAAHWYPAVIEASLAGVPLLLLTADRPPELHHRAAPQTIDQVKLFGGHVRRFFELGLPDEDPAALAGLGGTAALAVATSLAPSAGPVHLNAWFRKPLEPQGTLNEADAQYRAAVDGERERPVTRRFAPTRAPQPPSIGELTMTCLKGRRGLIVCGPGALANAALYPALERVARLTGFPLLAEAGSQFRFVASRSDDVPRADVFDPLLRNAAFIERNPPDLILQIGTPPTSKGIERLLRSSRGIARWVLTGHGWNDPFNQATAVIAASLAATLGTLAEFLSDRAPAGPDTTWGATWTAAGDAAAQAAAALAERRPRSEAAFVHALPRALAPGSLLFLGNSLPVREIDLFAPGGARNIGVLTQRGANGIDGLVSGAAGAASVGGRPLTLLLGDVALVHDLGGLVAASTATVPLDLVVIDNGGGRIFDLLPVADDASRRAAFEAHFLTPRPIDRTALAAAHGIAHRRLADPAELAATLGEPGRDGPRLLELVVDGNDTRATFGELEGLVHDGLVAGGLLPR